jgi:hypothetical protein
VFLASGLVIGLPGLLGLAGALTDYCLVLGVFFLALFGTALLSRRSPEPGSSGG